MSATDRGERLLLTAARLNRWATRRADLAVPPAQGRLLALMEELGPTRIGDLAHADHCSQPTMTTQVQRVEAAGWVERSPDPSDARASLVRLTPTGEKVLARAREARASTITDALADLTPHQEAVLDQAITLIQDMLSREQSRNTPR